MPRRLIDVSEIWQNLKERLFHEDIDCDPPSQRRFFISNLVQRTLAHVVGKGPSGSVQIEATSAGELKVATVGVGLENYQYFQHTTVSDAAVPFYFTPKGSSIDIVVEDNDASIRLSVDGVVFNAWFTLKAGESLSRDIIVKEGEFKNKFAGQNITMRGWGYY